MDADRGIITGPISRIVVLDVDSAQGLGELEKRGFRIPLTWTVRTPRGWHYYFRWTDALETKVTTKAGLLPDVDVRGAGGYVVFYGGWNQPRPPALALPPQWLIDLLPNKEKEPGVLGNKTGWLSEALQEIKNGNRNDTFARIAGRLRNDGYSVADMFELLSPKAREANFSLQELKAVCESVGRYEPKKEPTVEETDSFIEFMKDAVSPNYVVPGFFAENTINLIAGLAESRKSWILLDLAVAVASGTDWLSKFQTKKTKVLLIDQERPKLEMQRRLNALLAARQLSISALEGQLTTRVGTTMRINLEQSFEKLDRLLGSIQPEVVMVDSLKTFQTGNITDNQSMQEVFERIKTLRNKHGVTFVILHHENKGAFVRAREGLEVTAETIAGAASIIEVPEGIFISVSQDPESSMLYHVKNSYGYKQPPVLIKVTDGKEDKTAIKVEGF